MRRPLLPIVLVPLFLLATALFAQEGFVGRHVFSAAPGAPPLMVIELDEVAGEVVGIGQTTPDMPGIGASVVTVTGGASLTGNLQLDLTLEPFDTGSGSVVARFQVIDGPSPAASLIVGGQTIAGVFGRPGGTVPQPQPEPATPAACEDMEALTDILNAGATTDIVQIIRGIYTEAGLAFGGQQTPERCAQVLTSLQNLVMELEEGALGEGDENCTLVDNLLTQVWDELEPRGIMESAEIEGILANAGLQIPGLNPGGVWNDATCARAVPGVEAYLARVRALPPGTGDGGADYPPQSMVVLPVNGFAPADGGSHVELWAHNGSEMVFETGFQNAPGGGNGVSLWYWAPRAGLRDVGVRQGTRLFAGTQNGTLISGEAMIFTPDCGAYGYYVEGNWFDGAADLVLRGERPVIDDQCRVTDQRVDTLVFTFVSFEPGQPLPQVQAEPQSQTQPQTQTQTQSNGTVLTPLGAATITNSDLIRQAPQVETDEYDTPGFGVWAGYYEVYDVRESLNVRSGPGTNFGVLFELPRFASDILVTNAGCTPDLDQIAFSRMGAAAQAQVLSTRWCSITWNGRTGWVFGRYIRPY